MALELDALVPATPDLVASVLFDVGQARECMPAIQEIERLDDRPLGVGTAWKETRGKRSMVPTVRVVAFEPGTRLALRVESDAMEGDLAVTLTPKGPGTEVHYTAPMKGRGMARRMTGTINRMMAEEDHDLLHRLEAQVAKSR